MMKISDNEITYYAMSVAMFRIVYGSVEPESLIQGLVLSPPPPSDLWMFQYRKQQFAFHSNSLMNLGTTPKTSLEDICDGDVRIDCLKTDEQVCE